jgi:DNA polymerase III gamma/tau subunit
MSDLEFAMDIIHILQKSPMLLAAKKEIKNLKRENKILRKLLTELSTKKSDDFVEFVKEEKKDVIIKIEPGLESGNITYELIESDNEAEAKEETEEVEEEEEEEEVEEAEAEEVEDTEEVEEVEEEKETEEEEKVEDDQETEVYEVTIRGTKYFTTDSKNGTIYAMDENGDVGDEVGQFKNGIAKIK